MKVSYKKLWVMLAEKEISKQICEYFDCNFGDICDAVKIEETEKKQEEVS